MIKHCVLFVKNIASCDDWNLYGFIRLGAMWSIYWNEITDQIIQTLANVLMSYQWEIEFYYRGNNHSAILSICVWSICLYLTTSFPGSLGFLIGRKAPSFISKSQHVWERGCVFSYSVKTELWLLTHCFTRNKNNNNNRWVKKEKKNKNLRKS